VVKGTLQLFLQYDLGSAVLVSTKRILLSFLLASSLALPLGILMGAFEPINRFFEPVVAPLRYMPISAFIPLLILWFGIYESEKIAFLFLGVWFTVQGIAFLALFAIVVAPLRRWQPSNAWRRSLQGGGALLFAGLAARLAFAGKT